MMGTFEAMKKQKAERHVAHRLATAMICCGVLCSGTAFAAENSGSTAAAVDEYALDDTVVTAERIPTSKMDTPANVTVISAKEIEENHYILKYNEQTLKKYPYKFELHVIYKIVGDALQVSYEVKNIDNKKIYFGIFFFHLRQLSADKEQ